MASHARMHRRPRSYHSHIPQFKSLSENVKHTPTTGQTVTAVELSRRATSSHAESSTGGFNATIPIAVGICVPLVAIIVTFLWLHRRHVKKIRAEERADPHKSLDFGMETKSGSSRGGKAMAEMDFEKSIRRGHGLSMDIGNPYLLPPELQNSRESLNSLSRNMVHEAHDPYRPATTFFASAPNSTRNSLANDDSSSVRTGSTRGFRQEPMTSPLVPNAQRMPFSSSPIGLQSIGEHPNPEPKPVSRSPLSSPPVQDDPQDMSNFVPPPPAAHISEARSKSISPKPVQAAPQSENIYNNPLPVLPQKSPVPQITVEQDEYEDDYYDESHYMSQPPNQHANLASPHSGHSEQFYTPTEESHGFDHHQQEYQPDGLGMSNVAFDNRRLSVMRPLPPDDPNDTPQQRAQRIRSFYKEYFNEHDARVYQQGPQDYYEDYGQEYLGDGAIYDPQTGQFIVAGAPFAEPITRRAMTPPPRGPPRFSGRHNSSGSSPSMPYHGRARAFSSASAGGFRGPGPKRHAPSPAPLRTLPTPHLLKEDAFSLPIDFAPPVRIKDQAAGRAPSPMMEPRPFSPSVAIASPLASSFNELAAMPSPHHLRKSGTFTALDFAPPPRFRDRDNASDAGSIRSGRSNYSTSSRMQVQNIRAGAYRVSRIPKELVGTQNEFAESLKPTWKVGS